LEKYNNVHQTNYVMYDSFLYIDPGSMSAFAAMIIGALAGAAMYIKIKWQSLKFRNKINK